MDPTSVKIRIEQFLRGRIKNIELDDDADYFALGFVNSLFAMQLVLFVEKEFQIAVEDEDLRIENFNSISALTNFVRQKLEPRAVTGG